MTMALEGRVFAFFLASLVWVVAVLCQLGPFVRLYAKAKSVNQDVVGFAAEYLNATVAVFVPILALKTLESLLMAFEASKGKLGK